MKTPTETRPPVTQTGPLTHYGRFQVVKEIGRGGTALVLQAIDPDLERVIALKVVRVGNDDVLRERLLAEARIVSKLEHPNIVPVYEMGAGDGWLYFAMRLIEGYSLSSVLRGRSREEPWADPWTRHKLVASFLTLCRAVAYAHEQGVIHQDLKPANVMLGEYGEVQLVDWGIAQSMEPGAEIDDAADVVRGTPGYISPERVRNKAPVDARSDIWALGVILCEMLTLQRAFRGKSPADVLMASLNQPAANLRALARAKVPQDLAGICVKATAVDQDERFQSVQELCDAIEGYLDGRARRERAAQHLSEAHTLWAELSEIAGQRERLLAEIDEQAARVPEWAPLEDKGPLLELRQALLDLEPQRAALFGRAVGAAERAATEDAESLAPRLFLAKAFWSRFLEAEESANRIDQTYFIERVQEWDDGELADERRGQGSLSLRTDPAGAEVLVRRFDTDRFVWDLDEPWSLGQTPLQDAPLDMGSYLLTLRHPVRPDVTYPVHITRKRHWDSGPTPLVLPGGNEIEDGFVFVPQGPFRWGGDEDAQDAQPAADPYVESFAISRFPVTQGEYCEFINALHRTNPGAAWDRVPRYESGVKLNAGQYWERPEEGGDYVVPELDRDGDPWDPDWPVMGVSWEDAQAYIAWRSERDGRSYSLPTEQQWEKAARGVDGRLFPWGDGFDPSLCHMRSSRPGRGQPEPVGSFPTDVSVYGVRDLAGGVRDWCNETSYGNTNQRPVRGGAWDSHEQYCRIAHRTGYMPWYVFSSFGIRLVQLLPSSRGPV